MLRRSVTGFRALRQSGARTARRKLYHVDQVMNGYTPQTMFIPPYTTDLYTLRTQTQTQTQTKVSSTQQELPESLRHLENILAREEPPPEESQLQQEHRQHQQAKKRHDGALANEVYTRQLPQRLRDSVNKSSDQHVRLDTMLSFKDPLKVYYPTFEVFVREEFRIESTSELITHNLIGPDLITKLMKYQLIHKRFDQVAEIYHHSLFNSFNDTRLLTKLNDTLFSTLHEDHDLEMGVTELFKWIYGMLNNDTKLFKMVFVSITNNGQTLSKFDFKHTLFLDMLRVVQLESFIRSCSDVRLLPVEYKETRFDYVNLVLALRLVQSGEAREGLLHLESSGTLSKNGIFHRFVYQALRDSPLSTAETSRVVLSFFKRCPHVNLGAIDKYIWGKVTSAQNYHRKTIAYVQDTKLQNELASIYLKKLLKQRKLGLASAFLTQFLPQCNHLDIQSMTNLISLTKDPKLLRRLAKKLTPIRRAMLFDMLYLKHCSNVQRSLERIPPEAQLDDIEWLLNGFQYRLSDGNMLQLNRFLTLLPDCHRLQILERVKGPQSSSYLELVKRCKSVDTILMLLRNRIFCTRDELKSLSFVIPNALSTNQIVKLLHRLEVSNDNTRLYHSMHQKITLGLISKGQLDRANEILDHCTDVKSKALLTDALLLDDPNNVNGLISSVSMSSNEEQTQLKTFKKLMDPSNVGMSYGLSKDLKRVFRRSKLKNKATSVMLVKHTIDRIKRHHNGEIVATDRLKWALSQCARYNVPKSVVSGLMMD